MPLSEAFLLKGRGAFLIIVAFGREDAAPVVIGLGVLGADFQDLIEVGQSLVGAPLAIIKLLLWLLQYELD